MEGRARGHDAAKIAASYAAARWLLDYLKAKGDGALPGARSARTRPPSRLRSAHHGHARPPELPRRAQCPPAPRHAHARPPASRFLADAWAAQYPAVANVTTQQKIANAVS